MRGDVLRQLMSGARCFSQVRDVGGWNGDATLGKRLDDVVRDRVDERAVEATSMTLSASRRTS